MRRLALLLTLALACKGSKQPGKQGASCGADADCQSQLVCAAASAGTSKVCSIPTRHYTFRAIAGVSMGAVGSSRLVAAQPGAVDAAGFMGGPLDATMLGRMLEGSYLGGFCSPAQLEAALAADLADGGNRLDKPGAVCPEVSPPPATHYSYPNRYNKWHYTTNGGHFDRDSSIDIFSDLMLGLGNPLALDKSQPQSLPPLTAAQVAAATCDKPAVVDHYVHVLYSPHGEHRAITFCDGEPPLVLCGDGTQVDWCAAASANGRKIAQRSDADAFCAAHGGNAHEADQTADADAYYTHHGEWAGCWQGDRKIPFALALDLNGNGRRDYNEPVVWSAHEPYDDVGSDGCPDPLEDGKGGCTTADKSPFSRGVKDPNGDNYDAVANPGGTEGNWRWDPGEPFRDLGLDGLASTSDFGEGDGQFTQAPGMQAWLDGDLRLTLGKLSKDQLRSLDLYADGGIRDIFDLGAQAEAVMGGAELAMPDGIHPFLDFVAIPPSFGGGWPSTGYDPLLIDPHALGRNVLIPYGNPAATPVQQRAGDGDHVGTVNEVYARFVTFFRWLSARWDPVAPARKAGGNGRADILRYASAALGANRDFVVTLPPGYDDPANADRRYPVLLLLHGYGQAPADFSSTSAIVDFLVNQGTMREMIIVYPDGRCCYRGASAGQLACTEDEGSASGYPRECARGSFFVDRPAGGTAYGTATLELFGEVDKRYRTLAPADGPAF